MKEIPLTQGKVAIVDDEDYDALAKFKWCYAADRLTGYAVRNGRRNGRKVLIRMHRAIMDAAEGVEVDHRDNNGLNNTRGNLRLATDIDNARNRSTYRRHKTSKFKGVSWSSRRRKWAVQIAVNGQNLVVGFFGSEVDAAKAYDAVARMHFGQFAFVNFTT